jgi:hypothetical protein
MANYYTYVSFTIPLTAEQQDWAIDELYRESDDDADADRNDVHRPVVS